MLPHSVTRAYRRGEDGSMMVLWALCLVAFLGLIGLVFDMGRLGTTQSELQSYADSIALAAAAELDGQPDALTRARAAGTSLISDTQTFAEGSKALVASDIVTMTFYKSNREGRFERAPQYETTEPASARFIDIQVAPANVPLGFGAILTSLNGSSINTLTSARAAAQFELEACNVAPIAMCAPTISLDTDAAIGSTLRLDASVNLGQLLPGNIGAVDTLTSVIGGLDICVGLLGDELTACLIASREPETACAGSGGGLVLSTSVDGDDLMNSINTRFGRAEGIATGLIGDAFAAAPTLFNGRFNPLGICVPDPLTTGTTLPADDCFLIGNCSVRGNGNWTVGRAEYVDTYFGGVDPFPEAQTRYEFYLAELEATGEISSSNGGGTGTADTSSGGLLGGVIGGVVDTVNDLVGQVCAPQDAPTPDLELDTKRRLMVIAAVDCLNVDVQAGVRAPVVQYFEAFALGSAENGVLDVEVTACLGSNCKGDGRGNLDVDVRDVVRLVE
ncbi:pilus assembly protein TadG-related protein [Sulfitobacter sp. S223]|uniref:TadE/TadG family type IV pilus assembly protein n=1 Tax=Sulfitobacter sp. S223 TaxID=2867023 RepID=UPI0021A90374|nr:pilus assembly protein TadG-related protein [Sulfitobacter sp. S223]UWR25884.1 pilus assembly protein TadG-related protein [Sulfitobacter sp. S223]